MDVDGPWKQARASKRSTLVGACIVYLSIIGSFVVGFWVIPASNTNVRLIHHVVVLAGVGAAELIIGMIVLVIYVARRGNRPL